MKRRGHCSGLSTFSRSSFIAILLSVFVVISTSARPGALTAGKNEPSSETSRIWKGPDGEPLPFRTDEGVCDFLRTATVTDMEEIPEGVTNPRRALLEKDGVRMRAIFRDVNISKSIGPGMEGRSRLRFRDCCLFEIAAYELSRLLGLDNVPPTVIRKIRGGEGTLQIWLEGTITERVRLKEGREPPSPWHHAMQHQIMKLFDNLIYNEDRNKGNVLYDGNWKLWMVDHTRAFRMDKELPNPEEIKVCERGLWEKLQALDEAVLTERLDGLLRGSEIEALLIRKDLLIAHINRLIEERGEKGVLFHYYEPRKSSP